MPSRQRTWQLKQLADGKCRQCGQPRGKQGTVQYCQSCNGKRNARKRKVYLKKA